MKERLADSALLCALLILFASASSGQARDLPTQQSGASSTLQELIDLQKAFVSAQERGDAEYVRNALDDDFLDRNQWQHDGQVRFRARHSPTRSARSTANFVRYQGPAARRMLRCRDLQGGISRQSIGEISVLERYLGQAGKPLEAQIPAEHLKPVECSRPRLMALCAYT